jgi:hypothetical protein
MGIQMVLLAPAQTIGAGGATSVTFSSIPQTYTDLYILCSARTNRTGYNTDRITAKFNTVTTNTTYQEVQGGIVFGTNAAKETNQGFGVGHSTTADAAASIFGISDCYIAGYSTANWKLGNENAANMNTDGNGFMYVSYSKWENSSAITSVELTSTNSWRQYSTFYLYGIKNT